MHFSTKSPTESPARQTASTASSTTSLPSPQAQSSGNDFNCPQTNQFIPKRTNLNILVKSQNRLSVHTDWRLFFYLHPTQLCRWAWECGNLFYQYLSVFSGFLNSLFVLYAFTYFQTLDCLLIYIYWFAVEDKEDCSFQAILLCSLIQSFSKNAFLALVFRDFLLFLLDFF